MDRMPNYYSSLDNSVNRDRTRTVQFKIDESSKQQRGLDNRGYIEEPSTPQDGELGFKQARTGSLFIQYDDLTDGQITEMEEIFNLFDLDQDGLLNFDDMQTIYSTLNLKQNSEINAKDFIGNATKKQSDRITFPDFVNYFASTYYGKFNRYELNQIFNLFDSNHNGFIDEDDLVELFEPLNWQLSSKNGGKGIDIQETLNKMDINKDGRVCIKDFTAMMNSSFNPLNKLF